MPPPTIGLPDHYLILHLSYPESRTTKAGSYKAIWLSRPKNMVEFLYRRPVDLEWCLRSSVYVLHPHG